jgi:hypothetical protein
MAGDQARGFTGWAGRVGGARKETAQGCLRETRFAH